jgi:hypothetical protein
MVESKKFVLGRTLSESVVVRPPTVSCMPSPVKLRSPSTLTKARSAENEPVSGVRKPDTAMSTGTPASTLAYPSKRLMFRSGSALAS